MDKASYAAETLYQGSMSFHDFITQSRIIFQTIPLPIYKKSQWKAMLNRRLSSDLRRALMSAYKVPAEYHAFVGYLRTIDAETQSIRVSRRSQNDLKHAVTPKFNPLGPIPPNISELKVSQGGSAMDLDTISRQKNSNGRLTEQAKDANRRLGHCLRCNSPGNIVRDYPLGYWPNTFTSVETVIKDK